jgi:hypothetical protein
MSPVARFVALPVLFLSIPLGCGSSKLSGATASSGTGGGTGGGTGAMTTGTTTGSMPDGGLILDAGGDDGGSGCSAAAKLIYVATFDMLLYSFDPATLTFAKIGPIVCGSDVSSVASMAVDRNGTAWVHFISGNLYKVSTADATCTPTAFVSSPTFGGFGMGFVADAPGSTQETLYVSGVKGGVLGTIDTTTLMLTPIATFNPPLGGGELTGTADARLFGFWASPVTVGQIDKTTAAVISQTQLPAVAPSGGFAFSFWGGDFWLFTAGNVYQYTPPTAAAPSVATYPFTVVGAGVSTCAPLTPPT